MTGSAPGPEERWRQLRRLFVAALEQGEDFAPGHLTEACGGDDELRRDLESLLSAGRGEGALERLGGGLADLVRDALAAGDADGAASPPSPPPGAGGLRLAAGDRVGRFEVLDHLGGGGMGEVYRVRDTRLGREVALKVVGRSLGGAPGAVERFEEEARASSALNHPNIVVVHDIGEARGFPYIVMERVEGRSLRSMLGSPLPLDEVLALGAQIAEGLAAAHGRGIVHRDLKPENVMVDARGTVKILDFGLARFQVAGAVGEEASLGTVTGGAPVIGTPGYLAPEVAEGHAGDHRADQFALGALLYEMATGETAFPGQGVVQRLAATLRDQPPRLGELPPALGRVVRRTLAKHPRDRYANTREIVEELAAAGTAPGRSALPVARTPLVGRGSELAQVVGLLRDGGARLVTLSGPGGSGKTRLALEAAAALAADAGWRAVFVPLAAIRDRELVLPAIARALELEVPRGRSEGEAVVLELAASPSPVLLLLDNFEQVVDAASRIGELLSRCPRLAVLVTSRQVLRLYGEHDVPVPPLALPSLDRLPPVAELAAWPAIQLFCSRARAASPAFRLEEENARAVAELCTRLDGLPLALELAAAGSRLLSPAAMLARLGRRLELGAGRARDLPARQQTLRQTLDWSHQLLDTVGQTVLRRVAVFAGGFTLEAAEAVADPFGTLVVEWVEALGTLVDQSLVRPAASSADGEPRFEMLETIREYALERLAEGGDEPGAEEEAVRRAHAAYFLVLAEEGGRSLAAGDDRGWLVRLEVEHDNFRTALAWLTARGDAGWGLRLANGLFRFWERGEHLAEGRRRLAALLALPAAREHPPQRAKALFHGGVLASTQGDYATGIALQEASLDLHRELGDRWGEVVDLNALGIQHTALGELATARRRLEESLVIWEELGDTLGHARSLSNLAHVARLQGDVTEARRLYRQATADFERIGDRSGHAWSLDYHGDLLREQGDLAAAAELYHAALAIFRALGERWGIASTLGDLGTVERLRGEVGRAAPLYREALEAFAELGHRRGIARLLGAFACLAVDQGQPERALRLAGAADALRDRVGAAVATPDRAELERTLTRARRDLGPARATAAWSAGAELSPEAAIALARQG